MKKRGKGVQIACKIAYIINERLIYLIGLCMFLYWGVRVGSDCLRVNIISLRPCYSETPVMLTARGDVNILLAAAPYIQ